MNNKFDFFYKKVKKIMKNQKAFNVTQEAFNESLTKEIEEIKEKLVQYQLRFDTFINTTESKFDSHSKSLQELIELVVKFHAISRTRQESIDSELAEITQHRMSDLDLAIGEIQIQGIFKRFDEPQLNGFH